MLGENASLISGGQAQRLQIARALVRPAKVLILDECMSALDPANQKAVLETVMHAQEGRTTVMVTHKVPVMRMCDRVVVLGDGVVKEQGAYEELMARARACLRRWRAVGSRLASDFFLSFSPFSGAHSSRTFHISSIGCFWNLRTLRPAFRLLPPLLALGMVFMIRALAPTYLIRICSLDIQRSSCTYEVNYPPQ
jgi:ABC transporter